MVFQVLVSGENFMKFLSGYGVSNPWSQAGVIMAIFVALACVFMFFIKHVVPLITGRTSTNVDDHIIEHVKKPLFLLIVVWGFRFAAEPIQLFAQGRNAIESIAALLFVYLLCGVVHILISEWGVKLAKSTKTDIDEALLPLFTKFINILFGILAIMWVLSIWEVDITPWLAGLGVGGVVLGFALQDSLSNIFGGISLILDRTLAIGDRVKLETGELGEVVDVGLRSTQIKTFDNDIITIPNGRLANMRIQNYGYPNPSLRVKIFFGVEYGTKIDKVRKTIMPALNKIKGLSKDPKPELVFYEMADSALNFQANIWVDDYHDAWGKKLEATEIIYDELNKAKIGIPFPTRTVYTKNLK